MKFIIAIVLVVVASMPDRYWWDRQFDAVLYICATYFMVRAALEHHRK